ncbi:SDR family NAD(P)-dependent oxidoreductase [Stakelama tenebrarum]|uniref:SDR family oxidoreductase n=1 Tax=Stakelama tenebrarum TaxID=2711215 RepID=A0A6G6Y873_9SPHN|nr:SDR family oxidoreductase [Sphingosinithalassobacter tenebrarum]QIG80773.1 SDR family oxidoreductase [Sphingosinithalassobacter tenebrarum]
MAATQKSDKPVVLITGASAGIGDAIARRFAAAGWNIVGVARRKERLEALKESLAGTAEVAICVGDVTDPQVPVAAVKTAMDSFGRLDALVNNAGSGKWGFAHETDDATLDEVIDTSFKAPFRFAREAIPAMTDGGAIVNIGSTFGLVGGAGGGAYCAVKAGMVGLTQSLAADYGLQGIRTNLVAPGVIRTDMTDAVWEAAPFRRLNHEMTPMNREGTVSDVANLVYFLASDEGSYINGQSIALDGGWTTTKMLSMEALMSERVPQAAE